MSASLKEMEAETERLLVLLETKIEEAKVSVAEITESRDASRYWLRTMFEMQIRRGERMVKELRGNN